MSKKPVHVIYKILEDKKEKVKELMKPQKKVRSSKMK